MNGQCRNQHVFNFPPCISIRGIEEGKGFIFDAWLSLLLLLLSAVKLRTQDTLKRLFPLTSSDLFGPRTADPPKTYYLIYDSHGHYLPADKVNQPVFRYYIYPRAHMHVYTLSYFLSLSLCLLALRERKKNRSNEHKSHITRIATQSAWTLRDRRHAGNTE